MIENQGDVNEGSDMENKLYIQKYVKTLSKNAILKISLYIALIFIIEFGGLFEALAKKHIFLAVASCIVLIIPIFFFKSTKYIFDHSWSGTIVEKKQEKYIGSNTMFDYKTNNSLMAQNKTYQSRVTFVLPRASEQTETYCEKLTVELSNGKTKIYCIPMRDIGETLPYTVGDEVSHIKGTLYLTNESLREKTGKNICVICGKTYIDKCKSCEVFISV